MATKPIAGLRKPSKKPKLPAPLTDNQSRKKEKKKLVDAVFFDLDDTLITHSYGPGEPRPRDKTLLDFLGRLKMQRIKLFVISAYVGGETMPALEYLGIRHKPPKNNREAVEQKRLLLSHLLKPGLFTEKSGLARERPITNGF